MNTKKIASPLLILLAALTIAACSGTNNNPNDRKGGKKGHGGKPTAESFAACTSKTEGQSCSVSTPRGEMSGMCKAPRSGEGELACVPERKRKMNK